ncbi:MAG: hypothetical protein K2X52_27660 [Mycobacteriaceae bacterium]|nr:hypothetical protein [Mycobacteriaceae bacterium]
MFTLPLTAAEYRALVERQVQPERRYLARLGAARQTGTHPGLAPGVSGDPHWTNADAALHAFITTAKERRNRALLGWQVVPTEGVDDLAYLLSATRGELSTTPDADDDR